ncbi:MAG: bifunctional PIG-L family deacetylase/class I SAM-dependent methyltransferase [Pricia sp.]
MTEENVLNAPWLNRDRLVEDFGNLTVLAPHPDDESLGCGGLIAMLSERGARVSVIFVTDGSASHTSRTHPKKVLRGLREREAAEACAELGVSNDDIHFMREQDSGLPHLPKDREKELQESIAAIVERVDTTTLAVPWRRDPHPDHIAVYRLAERIITALPSRPIMLEYPIWLWTNGKSEDWPTIDETAPFRLDISKVMSIKKRAIQKHASQFGGIILDDPNGFSLSREQLAPFMRDKEFFFVDKKAGRSTLGKAYFDRLYHRQNDPWNFRESPYELKKYRTALSVLGSGRLASALELGCSVGVFTEMLAGICNHLKAIDISETAVDQAVKNCHGSGNIEFLVGDVTQKFPKGRYNLITCCEIGYYLNKSDLQDLFENIYANLVPNGKVLLVHWTPFVPDYPLTGDMVHDLFENFAEKVGDLTESVHFQEDTYRLQLWQKDSEYL